MSIIIISTLFCEDVKDYYRERERIITDHLWIVSLVVFQEVVIQGEAELEVQVDQQSPGVWIGSPRLL